MAVGDIVPVPGAQFEETLASASPDLLREMIRGFAQRMMDAEVGAVCGAGYGEVSSDRVNFRNGYRLREWDTRAGTVELAIPKLREGTYYPEWLLEHRRRAERALVSVVATSYLLGVSTRRVEKLVEQLGVTRLSKSQVSEMAKSLDGQVAAWRGRPLDAGPYTFVWMDALTQKVREAGRSQIVHALIAVGVNADGQREVLGLDVVGAEDRAGWLAFLRGLVARGLSGVSLVTSDCHHGLRDAIAAVLPGAAWQRCRAHYARNLATKVPSRAAVGVYPGQDHLRAARCYLGPGPAPPGRHRPGSQVPPGRSPPRRRPRRHPGVHRVPPRKIRPWAEKDSEERLNKEIHRRTQVVGIFPDCDAYSV